MKHSKPHKYYGRWLPQVAGTLVFVGFAGTLFALSEILENDTDNDGWTDAEEIIVGTNPADETDPWDSDGDGIADYLEFLDGSDPLDPFDPPRAFGHAFAYSVAGTTDEVTEGGDDSSSDANTPIFPVLEEASRQSMYHATAWYNGRVDLAFITPTAASKWQAAVGTELEYWNVGYYDLLARNNSKGIAITLNAAPAREYALCWKHMKRPDNGETAYTVSVKIGEEVIVSQSFTAPECLQAEGGEDVSLNFTLTRDGLDNVTIVFMPTGTSTSGPLVGSIELKTPNISLVSERIGKIYEGPYEIERTTIRLSGSVEEGLPKTFVLTKPFEISEGNLVEINIASDDAASVTIAPLELNVSTPIDGGTATGKSEWQYDYEDTGTLPVFVFYANRGDSYNLSITITVKKSRRVLYFYTEEVTGEQYFMGESIESLEEYDLWARIVAESRTRFGVGEAVVARVKNGFSGAKCDLPESCSLNELMNSEFPETKLDILRNDSLGVDDAEEGEKEPEGVILKTDFTEDKTLEITAEFEDGDVVWASYSVCIPRFETVKLVSAKEYKDDYEFDPCDIIETFDSWDRKCFLVYVHPMDVSFEALKFYEIGCAGNSSGIFAKKHSAVDVAHYPSGQLPLRRGNYWGDAAAWGESHSYEEVEDIDEDENGDIGTLIWDCPVRWQFEELGRDRRDKYECANSGVYKNALLPADGALPTRIQTMRIKRNSSEKTLSVFVEKVFPQPSTED